MAKKYVPSGYQIINIDVTGLIDGDELPVNEDTEILKELFESGKIHEKPILLCLDNGGGLHSGFVNVSDATLYYNEIVYITTEDGFDIDYGYSITITYSEGILSVGTIFEK